MSEHAPDTIAETSAPDKPLDLGVYNRPSAGVQPADVIAIALSGLWLIGVAIYVLTLPESLEAAHKTSIVMSVMAVLLPIALIWMGATVVKTARLMREEAARLQSAINTMRKEHTQQMRAAATVKTPAPSVATREAPPQATLQEVTPETKDAAPHLAQPTFASTREAGAPSTPPTSMEVQPRLDLDPPDEGPPLTVDEFIGALNFPEDESDLAGFDHLRRALSRHESRKLVRAAQDVLTLLSQEGIYMDDLQHDLARPEIWRRFAEGERGRTIGALGGVHDKEARALVAARMRADPVFRDVMHHFLRQFDHTFAAFAEGASDGDITRLARTRTSRAFMLLGRVAGTFD